MRFKLTSEAKKYLDAQDKDNVSRIYEALRALTRKPPECDIKPLEGKENLHRLRAGGYRIIYEVKGDHVIINKIAPRGQAYK